MVEKPSNVSIVVYMLTFVLVSAAFATTETGEGSYQRPQEKGAEMTSEYPIVNAVDNSTLKQPRNDRLTRRTPPAVFSIPDEGLRHLIGR